MRASRWIIAAAVASVSSLVTLQGCQSSPSTAGATAEGGISPVVLTDASWGESECAACTSSACAEQRIQCQGEPSCARNLDCVEACAATAEGDPDPACATACPAPTSSAAERARVAFESCRTMGAATTCATCAAAQRRRHTSPVLTSYCADGMYDASPDDTPVVTACSTCGATKCCGTHKAYVADPGALALRECIVGCAGTASCRRACDAKHDASLVAWWSHLTCVSVLCVNECQFPSSGCSACVDQRCGDERAACEADHDCIVLTDCIDACGAVADCQAACHAKYPAAVGLLAAQILCASQYCPSCK
jgi:hypothetical protein